MGAIYSNGRFRAAGCFSGPRLATASQNKNPSAPHKGTPGRPHLFQQLSSSRRGFQGRSTNPTVCFVCRARGFTSDPELEKLCRVVDFAWARPVYTSPPGISFLSDWQASVAILEHLGASLTVPPKRAALFCMAEVSCAMDHHKQSLVGKASSAWWDRGVPPRSLSPWPPSWLRLLVSLVRILSHFSMPACFLQPVCQAAARWLLHLSLMQMLSLAT